MTTPPLYRYEAFLSYRHADPDRRVAERLHRFLETYRVPAALVARGLPDRLHRIFRDREELPTSADLSAGINDALRDAAFLIVICSPRTPQSRWVTQEVETFIRLGRANRILTVLIEGEPGTAFPAPLIDPVPYFADAPELAAALKDHEPLAADLRGRRGPDFGRLDIEALRLLAPMIGCRFDDLRQRHLIRRRQRRLAVTGAVAAVLLAAGCIGFGLHQHQAARDRAEIAADIHDLAHNLRERWALISVVPVLDDRDHRHMESLQRTFPAAADQMIAADLALMFSQRADQVRSILHDYPVSKNVATPVQDAATRLGLPDGALASVHAGAERADSSAEDFRSQLAQGAERVPSDTGLLDLSVRMSENAWLRTELDTELVLVHARALLVEVCAPGCPPETTAWLADDPPPRPLSELMPLLQTAVSTRQDQIAELARHQEQSLTRLPDLLAIQPGDDSDVILGKSISLRIAGRPGEALAALAQWRTRFASAEPDILPLVAAAEQLNRQYGTLHTGAAFYVMTVTPDSPAARAGLQVGDVIVTRDGQGVSNPREFMALVKATPQTRTLEIGILRRDPDGTFAPGVVMLAGGPPGAFIAGI